MRAACHAFAAWSNVGADTARLSPRGSGMRPAASSDSTNAARILASRMVRNEPAKRAARVRRQDQREPVLSTEPVEEPHQVDDGAFLVCVASVVTDAHAGEAFPEAVRAAATIRAASASTRSA